MNESLLLTQSVAIAAYENPSAGIAAAIVTSTTTMGVAFKKSFGSCDKPLETLYGGRALKGPGGGGGARKRIFHVPELRGCVTETGELAQFHHAQYTFTDYRSEDNLGLPLPPHHIACRMHYRLILDKCNSLELKHLCIVHNILVPRKPTRQIYLSLLNSHECDGCEVSYAILAPVTGSPNGVLPIDSPDFASCIKNLSFEVLKSVLPHSSLSRADGGCRVSAVYTDDSASVDGHCLPLVQLPLEVLIPHLTVIGLKTVALHHGVSLPNDGQKQLFVDSLRQHTCTGCPPLYFMLQPLKQVKQKDPSKLGKPSWLDEIDSDERTSFLWETYVHIDKEPWPPRPTTMRDVAAAMDGFCKGMEPSCVEESGCIWCGQLTKRVDLLPSADVAYQLTSLCEDGVSVPERTCDTDVSHHIDEQPVVLSALTGICNDCNGCLVKGIRPKMSLANSLWLGEVPEVLKDLTLAEQALISRVRYNRCVVRVSSGHAKMIANVISFEHPSMKIYDRLPLAKDDLDDVLAVVFTGVVKPNEDDMRRTPVLVRRNQVKRALEWLKLNHRNYADLEIDYKALNTYALEDVPIGVWHKPLGADEGNVLATTKSIFDNEDELGTSEGPCPFTVHGLTTEKFSTMSSTERKLAAVQHLKNGGQFLAVGHAASPQSIWENPDLYPQMFPWLFPFGYGGVGQEAHKGLISKENHLRWLLLYHDKRFQKDAGFLIVAFNHQLIKQNSKGSFMMCKRNNFAKVATSIRAIHPGVLASIVQRMRSGARVTPTTEEEKRAFCLLDQVDIVGTHVNGSLASKKQQRNEIWSMVNFMGTPNWFITLSPADNKHPLCIYWASHDIEFKPEIRTAAERLHLVTRNPVACARFFDYVVRLFIEHILGWKDDGPTHGIFGKPSSYYGSVEQQGRMTLHLHILIWIANALSPQAIRDRLMSEDGEFQRRLVEYIESCQIGEFLTGTKEEVAAKVPFIPDQKLRGIHTILEDKSNAEVAGDYVNPTLSLPEAPPRNYCRNVDDCDCSDCEDLEAWYGRFQSSVDDIMLRSNVHKCFGRKDNTEGGDSSAPGPSVPQRHATGKGCINKDGICTARFPREIYLKTFVDLQTGQLFMKKLESSINTVTPIITRCFLCNTDTTSLMSGTAVKAIIGYVTDYVTKGWLKTHQIFSTMYDVFTRDSFLSDKDLKPARCVLLEELC